MASLASWDGILPSGVNRGRVSLAACFSGDRIGSLSVAGPILLWGMADCIAIPPWRGLNICDYSQNPLHTILRGNINTQNRGFTVCLFVNVHGLSFTSGGLAGRLPRGAQPETSSAARLFETTPQLRTRSPHKGGNLTVLTLCQNDMLYCILKFSDHP